MYSLYLDAPTLTLYWQIAYGLKNRFKLRIRFYDDEAMDSRHRIGPYINGNMIQWTIG